MQRDLTGMWPVSQPGDLRATLHPDGADSVEALLGQIAALSKEVHPTALEVLVFKEVYLKMEHPQCIWH